MPDRGAADHLLAATSRWTAGVRARESLREDRLFNDPWAASLAGTEGAEWVQQRSEAGVLPIVLRIRFFDDFLQEIAARDGIRQIVLMAAGLDTRAYRLAWPQGTHIFELDQPEVLAYKTQTLSSEGAHPTCERQSIEADLTGAWAEALTGAGFDPQQPSGWLLEGFLFYLPNESITRILDEVTHLAAPGSWLGFDIVNSANLTSPYTRQWIEMQAKSGAPWLGTMEDPGGFVASRGWEPTVTEIGDKDANYGRWPYPALPATPDMPHDWFVTARKKGSVR